MKAIIAVSKDGFAAKNSTDDMKWTGSLDKGFFKLYTMNGVLLAGTTTYNNLPELPGRVVLPVNRKCFHYYANNYNKENYICIGGFTLLKAFLEADVLNEVVVCYSKQVCLDGDEKYNVFSDKFGNTTIPKLDDSTTGIQRYNQFSVFRFGYKIFKNEELEVVMYKRAKRIK
jgi:dihydrofolate reductase